MACQRCTTCNIGWPVGTHGCAECGGPTWYNPSGTVTQAAGKPATTGKGDAIECHACGYEVTGYTRTELAKSGWQWHEANGRPFVMCKDCERSYADRRLERALGLGAAT